MTTAAGMFCGVSGSAVRLVKATADELCPLLGFIPTDVVHSSSLAPAGDIATRPGQGRQVSAESTPERACTCVRSESMEYRCHLL